MKKHFNFKLMLFVLAMFASTGQMWGDTTFSDGDVLFYDFTAVSGDKNGVNWRVNNGALPYDQSGNGTIKCVVFTNSFTWTTYSALAKTNKGDWNDIKMPEDRPDGKNCLKINAEGTGASWTTISLAEKVAKGDFIMVYGGEPSGWGDKENYRFRRSNDDNNTVTYVSRNYTRSIDGTDYIFGPAVLPAGNTSYYQGHWTSNLSCSLTAGAAYVVRGTASLSSDYYSDAKATSGDNSLYQVKKQSSAPTTSLSPTCPSSITEGEKLSFTPGSAGVSVLGYTNTIKYYLKSGSTYTEKTLSDGKIDVSDLATGDYSIITLLYDGHIYVKASTSNFSVTPAEANYTVTYGVHESGLGTLVATYTSGGSSIGASPATVTSGSGLTFTASPSQTYYEVEGFYSNEDCTVSLQSGNTTTYTVASLTSDLDVYVKFKLKNFTVTYNNMTGATNDPSNPSSVTYETAEVTLGDPEKTGYRFDGWYDNSGFTGSKVTTIPTHTTANVSLWANWNENLYTITLENATASSVSAGCATRPSITAATAPFGMTFDHWDVSGGASVASTTSSTTTVSATSAGTVTAVYTQNLYAYVEGRFHIASASNHSSWTNSFCSGNWDDDCTNIQFDYDETNHRFYLYTYATPKELSTQIDSNNPYFFIRTSTSSSSVTGGNSYDPSPNTSNVELNKGVKQALQTSSHTYHLLFNSDDNTHYVTLYFDGTYVWYEYMPAVINNVALSATRVPPGVSITATPNMYVKGTENKAYCWKLFSDEDCTIEVPTSFTSAGNGKVTFFAPNTQTTYYLRLQIHSTDACNSVLDDEKVVSFEVTTEDMVFFKNVPNWGSVHVYFLGTSAYWDDKLGSGCKGRDNGTAHGMSRIDNTDIYYYDYHGNSNVVFDGSGKAYIAFTDNYKPNSNNFSGCQAAYRADFSECAPLYVPENYITDYKNTSAGDGQCAYYNRGYWTNYMSVNSGFTLHVYDKVTGAASQVFEHEFTGIAGRNTYTYTYTFTGEKPYTYGFKVEGCGGSWYGLSNNTMNINSCTNYNLYTDNNNCGLEITANLPHTFIFTLTGDGHVQMSIDYPLAVGDYRLVYSDDTHTAHPSRYIRARANGKDTISMWVNKDATDPILKVQKCTSTNPITWVDYNWGGGASPRIDISTCTAGVYNFYLEQDGSSALDVKTTETIPYVGSYYIRTNSVDGGWISYKTSDDNRMTYAQYPYDQGYGFDYYKTKWVSPSGANVTYTIACDYSESLCDTLTADPNDDPLSSAQAISLPQAANVRFGWNSKTNKLKRSYISGSTTISDRFLVLVGDANMLNKNGDPLTGETKVAGLNNYEMNFTDLGNWIYRADIKAIPGAQVRLTAKYNNQTQYFIGTAETPETIIGGDGGTARLMRVIYDFKINRLMTAWLPDGATIDEDITLQADMMLIREGQNAATQITFATGKSISKVHSIYGVMEFKKEHIAGQFPNWNADHAYEYLMYYISFPFDVKVRDIFGAGTFGENWIIQKYNGAKRAKIGWFAETSTFWETLTRDSTMHKYEGYLLLLDRISFNDPEDALWYKIPSDGSIYLYFPSVSNSIGTIKDANENAVVHIPSHVCNINRTFEIPEVVGTLCHKNTDSHWNVFGPPVFQSKTASNVGEEADDGEGNPGLKYFYSWNYSNNTLRTKVALAGDTVFKSMHGYMVQYAGDVTFKGAHIAAPASVAAHRLPSDKKYLIELQLMNESEEVNATYVELRENACDTFVLNEDMYMMRTSNTVDLYSFAGTYDVAANVLSVNNHVVPIGLNVLKAGTYRFTMPSVFSGTVTLVDSQTGVRQNLALGDYTVYLERGTYNNRISLEINIEKTTTSLEGNDVKDGKAHKFMKDGILYILKDGITYDARGNRVD